jgi:hypothetical protein
VADLDETDALAWLCEHLPRLRVAAGNRTHLERIVTEVRDCRRTAGWARTRLGVGDPSLVSRGGGPEGDPSSLAPLNIDPVVVIGEYVCPHDRCGRLGQSDDKGREPLCHLGASPAPMRFRGRL